MTDNQKPIRLQRRRIKGLSLVSPNGLPIVYVGRPTKWGNPYLIGTYGSRKDCVEKYRRMIGKDRYGFPATSQIQAELRGKNLACFCPLDQPCHADVLLEIANG